LRKLKKNSSKKTDTSTKVSVQQLCEDDEATGDKAEAATVESEEQKLVEVNSERTSIPTTSVETSESIIIPQITNEQIQNLKLMKQITIVLANASLTPHLIRGDTYTLLSSDTFTQQIAAKLPKNERAKENHRPDITHQTLLTLLDSPLNKAGNLRILIQTTRGVCIEVHPQTRIPRTYQRFAGLMGTDLEVVI
jgi:rRNA small subunit pseudouridine methyltransferase Nep1